MTWFFGETKLRILMIGIYGRKIIFQTLPFKKSAFSITLKTMFIVSCTGN
jgi:hypothetical protein